MNHGSVGLKIQVDHRVHSGLELDLKIDLDREIGVIFGPSGAGKSTLLKLIAGLIPPDSGSITLDGQILLDRSKKINVRLRDRRIGLIYQDDLLFPHLSVEQNVRFGLGRLDRRAADSRFSEVVELCGIGGLIDRDTVSLSGGERQRVGLARAIAPRPRLLLCDEPVSALDLDARAALLDRIKHIQRVESIPILYVTHSTDEAIAVGDQLFLLADGRVVAEGLPLEVLSSRFSRESIQLHNQFKAIVESNEIDEPSTILRIVDGPHLVVARLEAAPGQRFRVTIDADDIVLARGPVEAVSAKNLIVGRVSRVLVHGSEAEVLVATGGVVWAVGILATTVGSMGLIEGAEVRMIIKSRSCRVVRDESF